ncbi:MAG: aspartate aminotransferase family protein [Chloroflexi bacterium]|nr:aspartate aminotransferase family protein [Chloroflexota bacterium]
MATEQQLYEILGGPLPDAGEEPLAVIERMARDVPASLMAMPGPRFFGFVLGGGLPAAVAADWLTSIWGQNSPSAHVTPAAAAAEHVAAEWLIDLFGLPAQSSVGFVTGGTMANFAAMAVGRHAVLRAAGWDVEQNGLQGAPRVTVITGADAHVTLFAGLRMAGLGAGTARRVAVDREGRMRIDALEPALAAVSGPAIVCLQAGNVNSGAFDPFEVAVPMIRERLPDAWIHVDGAFGLWAAATRSRTHLVAGAAGADSWSTDAHKWLNVPFDTGLIFVRDGASHRAAMSMTASYLPFDGGQRDPGDFVPELSRRARGFPVYAALRSLGRSGVRDMVDRCCDLARRFADALRAEPGVQILNDVVLNQVLVRFDDSDDRTRDVIARVQADGTAWFGGGTWNGDFVMRISVINWWTREADVDRSLEVIRRALHDSRAAG